MSSARFLVNSHGIIDYLCDSASEQPSSKRYLFEGKLNSLVGVTFAKQQDSRATSRAARAIAYRLWACKGHP